MRKSIASFALFKRPNGESTEWLAQWNANWQTLNFVGGHKHERESFLECVIREVSEELDLTEIEDFVVADEARVHLEYSAWSKSAGEQTEYTVELFDVRLCTSDAKRKVESSPLNRWVLEQEIANEMTLDGVQVSETMRKLLTKSQLWTSTSNDG